MTRTQERIIWCVGLLTLFVAFALLISEQSVEIRAREHIKTADEITATCVAFGYFEWKGNTYVCYLPSEPT